MKKALATILIITLSVTAAIGLAGLLSLAVISAYASTPESTPSEPLNGLVVLHHASRNPIVDGRLFFTAEDCDLVLSHSNGGGCRPTSIHTAYGYTYDVSGDAAGKAHTEYRLYPTQEEAVSARTHTVDNGFSVISNISAVGSVTR